MPGHPILPQETDHVLEECKQLQNLVSSHDVVFLLTDTRESRWLPTLLCANTNKVIHPSHKIVKFILINCQIYLK